MKKLGACLVCESDEKTTLPLADHETSNLRSIVSGDFKVCAAHEKEINEILEKRKASV